MSQQIQPAAQIQQRIAQVRTRVQQARAQAMTRIQQARARIRQTLGITPPGAEILDSLLSGQMLTLQQPIIPQVQARVQQALARIRARRPGLIAGPAPAPAPAAPAAPATQELLRKPEARPPSAVKATARIEL